MKKLSGGGAQAPEAGIIQLVKGFIGGTSGILILGYLAQTTGVPWLMAPFGATCVLLFAVPGSPLAQPRNVIAGHFLTSAVGLSALHGFGNSLPVMSVAVGVAIALMQYTRTVHPPAGANPIVIILAGQHAAGISFLITPVLLGSVTLVVIAFFVNNTGKNASWPAFRHQPGRRKE